MTRGSVYWVNLGAVSPPEFGKTRPAVIVSETVHNEVLDSVVVLPLSTRPGEIWPLRVAVSVAVTPNAESFVVLPGIRQVSKRRLADSIGNLLRDDMTKIDNAMQAYLGT